jgi:hypothetical protein
VSSSTLKLRLAQLLLLAAVCAIGYAPVASHRFIQDDHPIVQRNPIVHRGDVVEIFTTDWWAGVGGGDPSLYRPVTLFSYTLERGADGKVVPGRAHVTNVALHALTSLLLLFAALRLGADEWVASLAALLFAAHPVHVAAVAPLTGRAEVLALLFSLGALVCYSHAGPWSGGDPPVFRRRLASVGTGACLFLALGSKEAAFATPLLLLALDVLYRYPRDARAWRARMSALGPAAIAVVGHLVLRGFAIGALFRTQQAATLDNPLTTLSGLELWATRLALAGRYAWQMVFPARLSADYSGHSIPTETSLVAPFPLLGIAVLVGLATLAGRALIRRSVERRYVGFASVAYLLPYLVIANLVVSVGVVYAERLVYTASAGFCLLAAAALAHFRRLGGRAGTAVLAIVGLLIVGLGTWRTLAETRYWKNEATLFRRAIQTTPANPRAHFTLGKILVDRAGKENAPPSDARYDEALELFARTVELWPPFWTAHFETGLIHLRRAEFTAALGAFEAVLARNPDHATSRVYVGMIHRQLGRQREAELELRRALQLAPGTAAAMAELAGLLVETGRPGEAIPLYREAIRLGQPGLEPALRRAERMLGGNPPR